MKDEDAVTTPPISITAQVEIEIPLPINFLKTTDGKSLPVAAVSKKDLRAIAKAWSEELISRGTGK